MEEPESILANGYDMTKRGRPPDYDFKNHNLEDALYVYRMYYLISVISSSTVSQPLSTASCTGVSPLLFAQL